MHFRYAARISFLAWALTLNATGMQHPLDDEEPRARKPAAAKKHLQGPRPEPWNWPGGDGRAVWELPQQTGAVCEAFLLGDWETMSSGALAPGDFQPLTPSSAAAAFGVGTVYGADAAGWFLSTGRRAFVQSTDATLRRPLHSYESLAKIAWATGVSSGTMPSARVFWDCGNDAPLDIESLFQKTIAEAPGDGVEAWIVAGQARFSLLRDQALLRSPLGVGLETPIGGELAYSVDLESEEVDGLLVALVVAPDASRDAAREIRRRFFPPSARGEQANNLIWRAHASTLRGPAPEIDPSRPFQEIWNVSYQDPRFPRPATTRQALPGTLISRAHLSVWAIGSVREYDLYPRPEFVDIVDVDRTILTDQKWASSNTFVGEPIYARPRLMLRPEAALALARVNARLRDFSLRLKVFDAYRPLSVTQRLWRLRPEDGKRGYLASPNVGSRHNRGAAVDCTLANIQGDELEMPSEYLCFNSRSHRSNRKMSPLARTNMNLLAETMAVEGFSTIEEEWWHFDAPNWRSYPVADVALWPEEKQEAPGASSLVNQLD